MTTLDPPVVHFSRGVPPPEAIPSRALAEHTAAVLAESADTVFQYAPLGRNRGDAALRAQLAALHGDADPDGVFAGNGSLQVLDLLTGHLLAGEEDPVVYVEAPTYDRAAQIFARHGARLVALPVDGEGLQLEPLRELLRERVPTFLYTIPDFQNPSGVTMSEERRRGLVDLAAAHGFAILEDVPYRELRYHGVAPPALAELAGEARVILLGSLSKVLSPGLRVGYAVTDPNTALELAALAEGTYLSPAPLCQAVAARCLEAGLAQENIAHVRELLRPRHDAAVASAARLVGGALLSVPQGGYYLSAHLPVAAGEAELLAAAKDEGIVVTRGSAFYADSATPPEGAVFLRLPFQALAPSEFEYGLERLVEIAARI